MPLVLVVDDDADIREIIQMNLEGAGYEVVTAGNGSDALAAVKTRVPDAMFLDVMMPDVDGWTVLETLKAAADRDISDIPVFMVTGLTDREYRLRGGIEGALRYITKPFDPEDLVRALESVLDPSASPEPVQRRVAQSTALEALARDQRLGTAADETALTRDEPRVRLTRLEHAHQVPVSSPLMRNARAKLENLTDRQRELLDSLRSGRPVMTVAEDLGMSRSNIYSSLRRIRRKLGLQSTEELLALVRQGGLLDAR
ncbi:MAG: response regulator [Acidimicrobiia bacterium]